MKEYICTTCKHDFKSAFNLKRHQESATQCTEKEVILDSNQNKLIVDIYDYANYKKIKRLLKKRMNPEMLELLKIFIDDKYENSRNEYEKEKVLRESTLPKCKNCNKLFNQQQGLDKHLRLNRCKKTTATTINNNNNVEQILNVSASDNSNVAITNNNIKNIFNTYNIINVNALGCESIDHISINDFRSIFDNIDTIMDKLCYHIFNRHIPNFSFYKNNLNKQIISYLNRNMEIRKMNEPDFINYLKHLLHELCIYLFHTFKDKIPREELLKYMQNLVEHQNMISNDDKNLMDKKIKNTIETVMDDAFRNKDIKTAISNLMKVIQDNLEIKNTLAKANRSFSLNKFKIVDNYYNSDTNQNSSEVVNNVSSNIANSGETLYNLRKEAIEKNKIEKAKIIKQSRKILRSALSNIDFDNIGRGASNDDSDNDFNDEENKYLSDEENSDIWDEDDEDDEDN